MTDHRAHAALPAAARLVCAVADEDPDEVAAALDGADLPALAVVLASMVDPDRVMAHGEDDTRALVRDWRAGLTDAQCRMWHRAWAAGDRSPAARDGEREYQARRARAERAAKREGAA